MLCSLPESGQVDTALCFCSQLPYSLYFVPLPCFLFLCCLALCFGCFALFWLFCFFFSGHVVFNFFFLSTHTLLLFVVFFLFSSLAAQLRLCLLPLTFHWCGVISWISPDHCSWSPPNSSYIETHHRGRWAIPGLVFSSFWPVVRSWLWRARTHQQELCMVRFGTSLC